MNLFILSNDLEESAKFHADCHVGKMILEAAQLLSTTFHVQSKLMPPYRRTHENHPCRVWTGMCYANFNYTVNYALALGMQNHKRNNKWHKSLEVINWARNRMHYVTFPINQHTHITPHAIAINPTTTKAATHPLFSKLDVVNKYRLTYFLDKFDICEWKRSETPYWFNAEYFHKLFVDIH